MKFLGIKYHLLCCLLSVLFLLNVPVPAYAADVNNSSLSGDATITNPGLSTQAPVNSLAGATSGGAASTSSSGEDALTETTLSGVSALTSLAKRTVMTAITKGLIKVNTQTGDDKLTHYIITTGLGAGTSLTLTQMKAQLNAISSQITQVQSSVDHMNASMESQFTQASQTQLREAYYDDLSELDEIYTDVNDKWTNYNNYMLAAFDYVATDNGQPIENADGSYKILGDTPEEVAENTKLYNDAIKQAQDYLNHNVNMSDMDKYISRVQSIAVSTSANPSVYDRFDAYATACYPFTYQTVGPANALLQYVSGIQYEAYLLYSERAYDNVLDNPDQASDYNDYVQQHYNTVVNTVNTAVDNTDIIDRLNTEGFDTSQFTEDGDNDIDKAIYKRDDNNEITEDLLLDSLVVSIPLDDYYKGATTGGTVAGYRVTTQDNVSLIIATQAVKIGDYMETVNGVTQLSIPMVSKDGRYEIIPSYDSINSLFKMAAVTPVDAYNWLATAGGLVNLETMQANLMLTQQDSASNKTYMEYQGMECDNFDTAGADYALRTISLQDGGSGHPIVLGDGHGQIDNAKDATLALIYFDRTQRFENNVDKVTTYGGSFDDSSDYYLREGETLDISEMNGDVGDSGTSGATTGHVSHVTIHVYGDNVTIKADKNRTYKNISLEMDGGNLTIDGGLNTTMTDHSSRISYGDNTITLNNGASLGFTADSSTSLDEELEDENAQTFFDGLTLNSGTTLSVVSDGTGTLSAEGLKCANGITVPDGATLTLKGLAQVNAQGHSGEAVYEHKVATSVITSKGVYCLSTGIGVSNNAIIYNSLTSPSYFYTNDFNTQKVGVINITDCANVTAAAETLQGQDAYTADAIGYGFAQGTLTIQSSPDTLQQERIIETAPNGSITNSTIQTDGEVGRNFTMADNVHFKNAAGAVMTPYYLIARTTDTPDSGTTGNLCCNVGTEANFLSGEVLSGSVASNSYVTMRFLIPEDDPNVTYFGTALKNDDSSDGVELSEVTLVRGNTSDAQNAKTVPLYYRYDHNTTAQFGVDDYTVVRTKMNTSTADDAGTDANLKVQLLDANGGVLGEMGYAGGGYGDYDPLESGSTDAVNMSIPKEWINNIKAISFSTDGSGKKPGWKLEKLEDTIAYTTGAGFNAQKTALFTDDSLTVDQWIVEAGRQYTFSLDEANPTQYQVKVKTSDIDKAGTDANIKIDLQNDGNGTVKKSTGAVDIDDHTDQEQDDILEKGDTNTFNIAAASPLDAVNKIILTTDGAGTGPDWHPDSVTVTPYFDGNTIGSTSTFVINDWIRDKDIDYVYSDKNTIATATESSMAYLNNLCDVNCFEGIREDILTALTNFDLKDLRMKISRNTEIKETLLSLLKAKGKGFLLEKYDDDGNFQYSWRFEPEIMGDHLKDLNLNITKTDSAAPPVSAVGSYTQATLLHFDQQGSLGLTASIRYALDPAKFAEGTAVDIYHVSENGSYQKIASTSVLEFSMVRFDVSDGGDYLIVGTSAPNNLVKPAVNTTANATNVNTGLNATSLTLLISVLLAGFGVLVFVQYKKHRASR